MNASRHPDDGALHERIPDAEFRSAVEMIDCGDVDGLRRHLDAHRALVHQQVCLDGLNYFKTPTLLEFIAGNPVRHDALPANIVDIGRATLDAGASSNNEALNQTLALVCSGRLSRECGVQIDLIDLLCDTGAEPVVAMLPALTHGEWGAVGALIRRGAPISLAVASATGDAATSRDTFEAADPKERHLALALAAQHGHVAIVSLLLDSGEDPDRYNPVGAHAHATPLHQAALAGHLDVVRTLVERGARLDIRDKLYGGTPLDWARHGHQSEVVEYLSNV